MSKGIVNKEEYMRDEKLSDPNSLDGSGAESFGDFEIVLPEGIPNADSDEIQRMENTYNTPTMLNIFLDRVQQSPGMMLNYIQEVPVMANLGFGNYFGSLLQCLTTDANVEDSEAVIQLGIELKKEVEQSLKGVKTFAGR